MAKPFFEKPLSKPILIMGFKHTGKSVVGEHLARMLQVPFIDLDRQVEANYLKDAGKSWRCREIMQHEGEALFRALEIKALRNLFPVTRAVIALGGGALITSAHLSWLRPCTLIHLSADKKTVFQRILQQGRPAYIHDDQNVTESLETRWAARTAQYEQLADWTITNNGPVAETAAQIISTLGEA